MLGTIVTIVAGVVVTLTLLAAAFVIGMRTKSRLVQGPVIGFSRRIMNPRQLRVAGRPGADASIVRHRGRTSGRGYETPVGVVRDGAAFLIALPYGSRAQWARNVLAAGAGTLVTEGETVEVDRPELIATRDVMDRFPPSDQRLFRLFATNECLRLHPVTAATASDAIVPVAA